MYDDVYYILYVVIYWLFIVINYINLFVFDDEIKMKNRSTIQTLTFVQTNPDHLYMKLNMPGRCNHPVSVRKNWLLVKILAGSWLSKLAPENGTWRFFWLLLFGSQSSPWITHLNYMHLEKENCLKNSNTVGIAITKKTTFK